MPKALNIPPPLNTAENMQYGKLVTITEARPLINQTTQIGTTKLGIGVTINVEGKLFSQMFSLDKDEIAGSAGRVLVASGVDEVNVKNIDEVCKKLVGKQFTVTVKGGKAYWYK